MKIYVFYSNIKLVKNHSKHFFKSQISHGFHNQGNLTFSQKKFPRLFPDHISLPCFPNPVGTLTIARPFNIQRNITRANQPKWRRQIKKQYRSTSKADQGLQNLYVSSEIKMIHGKKVNICVERNLQKTFFLFHQSCTNMEQFTKQCCIRNICI